MSFSPVYGEETHSTINWSKFNLSLSQAKQISELEQKWHDQYAQLKPPLLEEQNKIANLLGTHGSNPVEIMTLQLSIARKREQLSTLAMESYLKKRDVLNDEQQRALAIAVRQSIAEQNLSVGTLSQTVPDRLQGLMLRARNIWTDQKDH